MFKRQPSLDAVNDLITPTDMYQSVTISNGQCLDPLMNPVITSQAHLWWLSYEEQEGRTDRKEGWTGRKDGDSVGDKDQSLIHLYLFIHCQFFQMWFEMR